MTDTKLRLFWSSRSPYVRKVMVVAYERGLADGIERIPVTVSQVASPPELVRFNPFGQIPTLLLPDGRVLYDSVVICEYLDGLGSGPALFPRAELARLDALQRHAVGDLLLETYMRRYRERVREDARSFELRDAYRAKIGAALDMLERTAPPAGRAPDIGDITIAIALAYADLRYAGDAWRDGRDRLALWHTALSERPSMVATAFSDDGTR